MIINPLNSRKYEKISSLWSPSSSPWSSSSRPWWFHVLMECYHKIQLKNGNIVPCGKCPACLANQRQEWVFRLQQEYIASAFALFVTLTYDDEHVPPGHNVCKQDVQLFHKRLRKCFPPGILRFYLVAEYGDHTFRPHYHGLYFFNKLLDLPFVYEQFEKSWKQGFIKFGNVEEGSIVYCTKYCLKHTHVPDGRQPTFRLVSKMNGGLGYNYLKKMSQFHIDEERFSFVSYGGKRCRMPRYFKNKLMPVYKVLNADKYEAQKELYFDRERDEQVTRFKDFLKVHPGLTYPDAVSLFNEKERKSHDERDKLIIKHTQKQKM